MTITVSDTPSPSTPPSALQNPPVTENSPVVTIPIEARPDGAGNTGQDRQPDSESAGLGLVPQATAFGTVEDFHDAGDFSFTTMLEGALDMESGKTFHAGGSEWGDLFLSSEPGLDAMLGTLKNHDVNQPTQAGAGSIKPITALSGYAPEVAKGKRLDFAAEDLQVWESFADESLKPGDGSRAPEPPMEGNASEVELGKRLNSSFYPIRETQAFKIEDFTVADLLGI